MKKLRKTRLLGGLSALALAGVPNVVVGQDQPEDPQEKVSREDLTEIVLTHRIRDELITVVASGSEERVDDQGQSVTVIGREELENQQASDLLPVLERAPGVTVSRNGPIGGFSAVRIRGSEAEQVLVLIDGVRVNDPSSPGGGFDFSNAVAGNVRKVELLRGSNSVVWGSQAVGGVIALTTGNEGEDVTLRGEYGTFDTFNVAGSVSRNLGSVWLDVSGGYYQTDGFSSFAGGIEADGFNQAYVNGRALVEINDGVSAEIRGRYADGRTELDGFPASAGFAFADTDEYQDTEQWSGYAGLNYTGYKLSLRAGYSIANIDRTNFNPAFGSDPSFFSDGRTERAELRGNYDVTDQFAVTLGLESENSEFSTGPFGVSGKSGIDSVYGLLTFETGKLNISSV